MLESCEEWERKPHSPFEKGYGQLLKMCFAWFSSFSLERGCFSCWHFWAALGFWERNRIDRLSGACQSVVRVTQYVSRKSKPVKTLKEAQHVKMLHDWINSRSCDRYPDLWQPSSTAVIFSLEGQHRFLLKHNWHRMFESKVSTSVKCSIQRERRR